MLIAAVALGAVIIAGILLVTSRNSAKGIAQYNGGFISQEEFDTEVIKMTTAMFPEGHEMSEEETISFKAQVLNNMIVKAVYTKVMDDLDIQVEEATLNAQLDQLIARYGTKEDLIADIESKGFTYEEIQNEFRYQLRLQELTNYAATSDAEVSDEEIKTYYDEQKDLQFTRPPMVSSASHILIQNDDANPTIALEKIKTIREEILAGKDFAEAAKEYSEGPSGPNGGDLGSFGMGQMVPEFEAVAFSQPIGEVSEPVLTQFGYHLILVNGREDKSVVPFEDTVEYISSRLKVENFYKQIEDNAKVVKPDWAEEQLN